MAAGKCPHCGRILVTVDTKVRGDTRVRYQGCRDCKYKDGKLCIPARYAPKSIRPVGFARNRKES